MLIAKLNTEVYIVSTMDMSISFGLMQLRKKKKSSLFKIKTVN